MRYPYVRGVLLEMWREAKARLTDPVLAWAEPTGDPERARACKRAVGIFGAGMGGTAISALTAVPLVKAGGAATPFLITAAALAGYAVLAWFVLRDAPGRTVATEPLMTPMAATLRRSIT